MIGTGDEREGASSMRGRQGAWSAVVRLFFLFFLHLTDTMALRHCYKTQAGWAGSGKGTLKEGRNRYPLGPYGGGARNGPLVLLVYTTYVTVNTSFPFIFFPSVLGPYASCSAQFFISTYRQQQSRDGARRAVTRPTVEARGT